MKAKVRQVDSVPIKLVIRNYDSITPLIAGDVAADGVTLTIDRETPMAQFTVDESYQAGELSFAQYLRRLSEGNHEIIGLPIFVARGFRQRCFFIRSDSDLSSWSDLSGKRVGIDAWGASGHTWGRSLLREAGIDLTSIQWIIGPPEDSGAQAPAPTNLPAHATPAPVGESLLDMLRSGGIDVLVMSQPPGVFYEPDSPVKRLFPDFRNVEEEYARRVGFMPCYHIVGVRKSVLDVHPRVAASLFNAFDRSQKLALERRLNLADTAPWLLEELEYVARILGPNWATHGIEPNRKAIETFCHEIYEQGIISSRVAPSDVFADFERLMSASRS